MERGTQLIHEYLRHDKKFPHVWCPGCGNGILLGSLIRAIHSSGYEKDEIVLVSGIGCSGRLPVYVDFNTLHTTHGRPLTFATGMKLANPKLQVLVVMGDGDATAIGGNHFIHGARRNLNLTAIIVNNNIYGMTGGQYSPTTPYGARATTAIRTGLKAQTVPTPLRAPQNRVCTEGTQNRVVHPCCAIKAHFIPWLCFLPTRYNQGSIRYPRAHRRLDRTRYPLADRQIIAKDCDWHSVCFP